MTADFAVCVTKNCPAAKRCRRQVDAPGDDACITQVFCAPDIEGKDACHEFIPVEYDITLRHVRGDAATITRIADRFVDEFNIRKAEVGVVYVTPHADGKRAYYARWTRAGNVVVWGEDSK